MASPGVGLSTHVQDVVNHVRYEDLDGIVLLGFSYGGCVVTGTVDHIASRVRHLVYLDAFVPDDGQSVFSLTARTTATEELGAPWLGPPPHREFDDAAEAAFMLARRTPQPVGCFREPVRLSTALEDHAFSRTYIRATSDRPDAPGSGAFDAAAVRARTWPDWRYREVATSHMVASNRPHELADILLELA